MATEEKPNQGSPDQVIEEISNRNDIPATYEPPSPLTGCYLLIILGEPHSQEHKDIILQRLLKGLLSWNVLNCHVDLEEELNNLTNHAPEGEAARHGERLIQFASENLVTEILIHPQYNTLIQCMRNLLSSFTRHRHVIHSGYTFSGNGSWILQDATFSVSDFTEALQDYEVQRVMRAYPDTISMEIHCATSGHWNKLPDKSYAKLCKIRINSVDILDSGSERLNAFINYLSSLITPANLNELMESSDVVGNIRFSHPTLYVFPGGQGDAALFGINGFNMLVDGGFNRKSCFWDFTRHLDRLDAVLMTRINNANIQGLSSIIERKAISNVYPQLGYFFTNIPETKPEPSLESDKDSDPLLISLFERGQSLTSNLKTINLKPQPCYKDIEPINLYHKVGHGTLDMYVISPSKESKEVKEFLHKWNTRDQNLFATKQSKEFQFPLQNLVSICAMLVWQPSNPDETITRILFPGSTPDYKIMEGLDKMKHLEFVKHPVCTEAKLKQIEANFPSTILSKKQLKSALADKSTHEPILPSKATRTIVAQEKDNKTVTETKTIIKTEKDSTVDGETKIDADMEVIKSTEKEQEKDNKTASESKPIVKSRIDSRPPKSMEKKLKKDSSTEKKSSPITTPKKEIKQPKDKDKEIKSKVISRVAKTSPGSTPAKSTKEANNRKVFESKQRTMKTVKKEVSQTIEKKESVKELKVERKAISRRPKPIAGSPMKSVKKATKDNVIRRPKTDKGVASDSSLVSSPSADDAKAKKIGDQEKQILLDDLIEEQEAVREIEAVLQRSESKQISDEHRAIIDKQDSTTEADEDEEYIIIEKEEQYTEDSVNEPESTELTGKEEVKHQRDSQESEKKRKPSIETTEEEEEPQELAEKSTELDKSDIESVPVATVEQTIDIEGEPVSSTHKMNGDVPKAKEEETKTEEGSPVTDEKQPSDEKKTDFKEELGADKVLETAKETDIVNVPESQATAESGATTAPTLPEDEHITLDEIKENVVIEEKYIKEETKETQVVVTAAVDESIERVQPKPMQFDAQQPHLRELNIKTPDEVADLPVHEEADIATDETPAGGSRKASLRKVQEEFTKTESVVVETKEIKEKDKESPVEKKSPSPTLVEPKISSPVEKVEYKVEDLGKQFESTLKDVTGKIDLTDEPKELKRISPVDDNKPDDIEAASHKENILESDDHKSVSPVDIKQEEISSSLIQVEKIEIKTEVATEIIEEVKSVEPENIDSKRKDSVVDKQSVDDKADKTTSKSSSPDLKKEIYATESQRASLIVDDGTKAGIDEVIETDQIEVSEKEAEQKPKETEEIVTKNEIDISTDKVEVVAVEEEFKSSSLTDVIVKAGASTERVIDIIDTKDEKIASKSPSPDLKEKITVSPVPQKDVRTEFVASVDSEGASLIDDSEVIADAAKISEPKIDSKDKSRGPSPTEDQQISESRKHSVADTNVTEEIERKSASPVDKEQIKTKPQLVSHPALEDNVPHERKTSVGAATEEPAKSVTPTDLNLQPSTYTEVYDYSHPFDAQCPNELRETHITTVESPIVEKSKLFDLQVIDKTITEIVEGEDLSLNDIKEEDEEDRATPPREELEQSSPKASVPLEVQNLPPRSVSPREEEVLKIVANVAEVLKSEKDITDIIPDFNEDELEKNIMQRASTPEVFSTIKESADFHDLSASLSEAKTSTTSIDEKEQHEIAEKHQTGFQKETTDIHRKESCVSEVLDDSRRESAISTFSEKDFTKDESTLDKFSRSNSSLELKHDELEVKSVEIETQSEETQIEKTQTTEYVTTKSPLSDKSGSTSPKKLEELKSSTIDAPKVSEQKVTETVDLEIAEEAKIPADRKESISLKLEEDSTTVQRMLVTASSEDGGEEIEICAEGTIKFSPSATTPETFSGKVTPEVGHEDVEKKTEIVKESVEASHVETALEVDDLARVESTSRQSDRPDSVMSHFSDTTEPELKETCSSPEKQIHEKASSSSGKSTGSPSIASSSHGSVEIEVTPSDHKEGSVIAKTQEKVEKTIEEKEENVAAKSESQVESIPSDVISKSPAHVETEDKDGLQTESRGSDDQIEHKSSEPSDKGEHIDDDKRDTSGKVTPGKLIDDIKASKSPSPPVESIKKDSLETDDKKLATSDLSRPESAVSGEQIDKDERKSPVSPTKGTEEKPESRSQSVASVMSEEKIDVTQAEKSRSQSIVIEKAVISSKTPPVEVSRPESAASDKKGEEQIAKSPSSPVDAVKDALEKENTIGTLEGPGSALSVNIGDEQNVPISSTKKEIVDDEKSKLSTSPSPPESVKKDSLEKVEDKKLSVSEPSRAGSAASDISSKDGQKSPAQTTNEETITTKIESRSQSVASVISEEKIEIVEAQKSRSQSIVSEKQDVPDKATPTEVSRPESAASSKKDENETKSPTPKTESVKKNSLDKLDDKHTESPSSVDNIEHVSPTPSTRASDERKALEDTQKSRSQSIVSENLDISGKTTPLPVGRPESTASHISAEEVETTIGTVDEMAAQKSHSPSLKEELIEEESTSSKVDSVASAINVTKEAEIILPVKEEIQITTNKSEIVNETIVSYTVVETKDLSDISLPQESVSTDSSRPESRSNNEKIERISPTPSTKTTDDKTIDKLSEDTQNSRSQSIISEKADISSRTTPVEISRPESAASVKKDDEQIVQSSSHTDESTHKDSLDKTDDKNVLKAAISRPESAASDISLKDEKKSSIDVEEEPISTKSKSRSQSVASIVSEEKLANKESSSSSPLESEKRDSLERVDDKRLSISEPSRPESAASNISSKDGQKSSALNTNEETITTKIESRSQSVASVVSEEKIEIVEAQKSRSQSIVSEKQDVSGKATPIEVSRPESSVSNKKDDTKCRSPPESEKKDSLEKIDDKKLSISEPSRPESAASDIISKDGKKSPAPITKEEIKGEIKVESRCQSAASVVSEEKIEIVEAQKSRSQSIVSEKQNVSGKVTPVEVSRLESAASIQRDDAKSEIIAEEKEKSIKIESHIQSGISEEKIEKLVEKSTTLVHESSLASDTGEKSEQPEDKEESGDSDAIGVQIATGSTICDLYDSADKKTGDKGSVEDRRDLPKKTDVLKESRSKSVASISVFVTGKTPQSLDLEKITEVSKDDSNLVSSSRKTSDISTLIEDVKKIDEKIAGKTTTSEKTKSTEVTTITTTSTTKEEHLSSLGNKLNQQKSAHSSLESTTSDKGSIETVLDSGAIGSLDTKEHSFDLPSKDQVTSSVQVVTKEISTIKSEPKTQRDSDNESLPISDDEAITSSQKYSYEDYQFERSNSELSKKSDLDIDESQNDIPPQYGSQEYKSAVTVSSSYTMDPMMSASFYGELPSEIEKSEPPTTVTTVRTVITKQFDTHGECDPITHTHTTQETFTTKSDDHKFLDEADLGFEKALEEHRQARGVDVMSSITSKYEFSPSKFPSDKLAEAASSFPLSDVKSPKEQPKDEASTSAEILAQQLEDDLKKAEDRVASWGKPLGLPVNENPPTPKKERKIASAKIKLNNEKNIQKRANSPSKTKKSPIYMDLTYVPHNGNSYYSHVEFFKRVRARYYVFSGTEPSRDVYNALLEAKQTWEDNSLEVTIIPTYDTDVLGYWVAENEELLAKYHIDLSPSASRCTINLQDHETCCSAYRLEF